MELTEDDVLHILKLIDESKFDYFQLEVGELKITVSKGDPIPLTSAAQTVTAAPIAGAPAAAKPAATATNAPAAGLRSAPRRLISPAWRTARVPGTASGAMKPGSSAARCAAA